MARKDDEARAVVDERRPAAADARAADDGMAATPTILLVNDDDSHRYLLSQILRKAGMTVKEAPTGTDALRQVAERPDLVVLDIQLPDIDGFEVCRRIKENPATRAIPVLHLSAKFLEEADKARALQGGADGYLTQPVEAPELIATVKSLLRLRRAEDARASAEAAAAHNADRVVQLERELKVLERLAGLHTTAATAHVLGDLPLRESHPDDFELAAARYEELLDLAMQQREYQVSHPISEGLRALCDRIGFLRAGPRDVIDLYSFALKRKTAAAHPQKARAYLDEGRMLVLELMGDLVTYYRLLALGAGRNPASPAQPQR